MLDQLKQLLDGLRGAWRFRWRGFALACGLCCVGWIAVFLVPLKYEAKAQVFVNTNSALRPLLEGIAVETDLNAQLELMRQVMLSQQNLEKVVRETGLSLRAKDERDRQELIAHLREKIQVTGGDVRGNGRRNNLYSIVFRDSDRQVAQAVVAKLLDTFVEDTLGWKNSGGDTAQQFLKQQIGEYEQRLASAESKLAEFKQKNIGLLPDENQNYFSQYQQEMAALRLATTNLQQASVKLNQFREQLSGQKPLVGSSAEGAAGATAGLQVTNPYQSQLREQEARLDSLLLRFTEKHPDVIAAREQIERLREQSNEYVSALGAPGEGASRALTSNPVYAALQLQFSQAQVEVAALSSEVSQRRQRIAELQQRLNIAPQVEAELARLTRDYGVTKVQYEELLKRLETARISGTAEQSEEVDFRMIQPPTAAFEPVTPRPLLLLVVLAGALGAGGLLAFLMDQHDPVVVGLKSWQHLPNVKVLGSIRDMHIDRSKAAMRSEILRFAVCCAALLLLFGCVALFEIWFPYLADGLSTRGRA